MKPIAVSYASYVGLKQGMHDKYGVDIQVWYTERNGDGIVCVMPKEAKPENFPDRACGYIVFEWIDPDLEFGSGIKTHWGKQSLGVR